MDTATNESFGRRIAHLRLMRGMTQERLANQLNVSAQAVSKWENDQSLPDIMTLPAIADIFDVSIDELLGRTAAETAAVEPQPEADPEPEPASQTEPWPWSTYYTRDEPQEPSDASTVPARKATKLRIHIVDKDHDAVNLSIPLAVAKALGGISDVVIGHTGIDISGVLDAINDAEPGTIININDDSDRVSISLE